MRTIHPTALIGVFCLACAGPIVEPPDDPSPAPSEPTAAPDVTIIEVPIDRSRDQSTRRALAAIERGKADAEPLVKEAVNRVLEQQGVTYRYAGIDSVAGAGAAVLAPSGSGGPADCPFVGRGTPGGPPELSCATLGATAHQAATRAVSGLDPDRAIPDSFAAGDGKLADYRTWYAGAVTSSVEAVRVQLPHALRAAGACDRAPTPTQSVESLGVALGRAIMTDAINEQLQRLNVRYHYPDATRSENAVLSCQLQIMLGANRIAQGSVPTRLRDKPLCTRIQGQPILESPDRAQYLPLAQAYEAAVPQGLLEEYLVASVVLRNQGTCLGSPLVLDLDGDGVHLGGTTWFDLLGIGERVATPWIGPGDALLALDRDGNGRIDDGGELFGNDAEHPHGFSKLAVLDESGDGRVDARDSAFDWLRLWVDGDADGASAAGELFALPELGVDAIELDHVADDHVDALGNQFRQRGRFVRTGDRRGALGRTGEIVDVWMSHR